MQQTGQHMRKRASTASRLPRSCIVQQTMQPKQCVELSIAPASSATVARILPQCKPQQLDHNRQTSWRYPACCSLTGDYYWHCNGSHRHAAAAAAVGCMLCSSPVNGLCRRQGQQRSHAGRRNTVNTVPTSTAQPPILTAEQFTPFHAEVSRNMIR